MFGGGFFQNFGAKKPYYSVTTMTSLKSQKPPRLQRSNGLRAAQTRANARPRSASYHSIAEPEYTLKRLKRLIMAAVRVWELKRGVRD